MADTTKLVQFVVEVMRDVGKDTVKTAQVVLEVLRGYSVEATEDNQPNICIMT